MTRLAIAVLLLAACKPSDEAVARYKAAHAAALTRENEAAAAFDAALLGVEKLMPGEGKCPLKLGEKPDAWVVDDGPSGLGRLRTRIWERRAIGPANADKFVDSDKPLDEATARLAKEWTAPIEDVVFLLVDEVRKPKITGEKTYSPGAEHGRAWAYSFEQKKVLCASTFRSESSDQVEAKFFLGEKDRAGEKVSSLMLDLRRRSIESAVIMMSAVQ